MSDDFQDVSVVETVENTPSAEPVEPLSEELPAEIEATQINLAPADDVLTQNAQQAYAEQYMPDRAGGNAPITAAGQAAKAAAEKDKKSDLIEHLEQSERRKDWLERDHDFGGMRMSGHDLAKMIDFISNPQMQDKLRERLGKSGVPKEKIDKGMKELNEYIDLKKKEQDGGKLTEEQHRRLKEIEKSEEFKVVAKEAVNLANSKGLEVNIKTQSNEAEINASTGNVDSIVKKIETEATRRSDAYSMFAAAPNVAEKFIIASADTKVAANSPDVDVDNKATLAVKTAKVEASANNFM